MPETKETVEVVVGRQASAYEFLKRVGQAGGCIVSSNDCSPEEIAAAQAEKRFFVDEYSFGYVYRLPVQRDVAVDAAYARYDSDPRVSGPEDFDAFRQAVAPIVMGCL